MPQLKTTIDENAGFCFGVVKAIAAAEQQLDDNRSLYCLGDIVHNNAEVQRLRDKGLKVVSRDDLPHLAGHSVLIRAHGEPPSTYALAERNNIRLIDATCPIVLALQQKIRRGYQEMLPVGGQIVIFGKPGHAEVIGLNGQTDNSAIIVSSPDDIGQIDFTRPIRLYSQTTKSKEDYQQLIRNIEASLLPQSNVAVAPFQAFDTICNRVSHRAAELRTFALDVDFLSSSAHKFNGPKGIGFLYVRKGIKLPPCICGGAQEMGMRAGTENVASIVGMSVALSENVKNLKASQERLLSLEKSLLSQLDEANVKYRRNGAAVHTPGNISLSFEGFGGGMLLHRLDHEGICVSTGSACNSKDTQISYVLKAMNLDEDWAKGTIGISLGRYNTEEDVKAIAEAIICIVR